MDTPAHPVPTAASAAPLSLHARIQAMTVLVTGATAGFGFAIAEQFAAAGARVVACGRRIERLAPLAERYADRFLAVSLDVRERQSVLDTLCQLPAAFADVSVLVNNAGLALGLEPAHKTDLDDWETMVDTNIKGLLYTTHALLPGMVERGRGHIINIGSTAGEWPYPGGNVYGGTKAFVRQFSLNLRADLVNTPIRVTNLEPGLCGGTEFSQVRFHGDADRAAKVYADTQPLSAADIAETVLWIASRPAHMNINTLSVMPSCQAFGPLAVHRGG